VAEKLNIPRKQMIGHIFLDPNYDCDVPKLDMCWYRKNSIFWQGINSSSMIALYNKIQTSRIVDCPKLSLHIVSSYFYYYFKLLFNGYQTCILS